jgi:ribokinase
VDTDLIIRYGGATGQAIIQLDKNRQNSILLYAGGNGAVTVEEINRIVQGFNSEDTLVLQNEIVHVREIMEAAKKRKMRICLNPSPYNEKIENLPLELTDIFFVNEIEGTALAGMSTDSPLPDVLDRLVQRFPGSEIILTAGKDGAYYGFKGLREKGEIRNVPLVDTTGAGDTFMGYFIAARYKNFSISEALALACRAASIAVSRRGAMEAVPLAEEVFTVPERA